MNLFALECEDTRYRLSLTDFIESDHFDRGYLFTCSFSSEKKGVFFRKDSFYLSN